MQIRERIEQALNTVRPALIMDGGNVEFVTFDPESGVARLRLTGACGGCPMSTMTLKMGIEPAVQRTAPEVRTVEAIA